MHTEQEKLAAVIAVMNKEGWPTEWQGGEPLLLSEGNLALAAFNAGYDLAVAAPAAEYAILRDTEEGNAHDSPEAGRADETRQLIAEALIELSGYTQTLVGRAADRVDSLINRLRAAAPSIVPIEGGAAEPSAAEQVVAWAEDLDKAQSRIKLLESKLRRREQPFARWSRAYSQVLEVLGNLEVKHYYDVRRDEVREDGVANIHEAAELILKQLGINKPQAAATNGKA